MSVWVFFCNLLIIFILTILFFYFILYCFWLGLLSCFLRVPLIFRCFIYSWIINNDFVWFNHQLRWIYYLALGLLIFDFSLLYLIFILVRSLSTSGFLYLLIFYCSIRFCSILIINFVGSFILNRVPLFWFLLFHLILIAGSFILHWLFNFYSCIFIFSFGWFVFLFYFFAFSVI